jgi:ketosteroid isomerase-like protein
MSRQLRAPIVPPTSRTTPTRRLYAVPDSEIIAAFDGFFERLTVDRDAAAATALFVDDDDVWMSGSDLPELAIGREAIGTLHRDVASRPFALAFTWDRRSVRKEGDVGWVNAAGSLLVEYEDREPVTMHYRLTAVLVRRDGVWRWHTFNGSEPRSPG